MLKTDQLLQEHSLLFQVAVKNPTPTLLQVTPPEISTADSVTFLSTPHHIPLLPSLKSPLWIVTEALWTKCSKDFLEQTSGRGITILTCKSLQVAMAIVLSYFDRREALLALPKGISPQAWIHPSARIAPGVTVGPFTCIGPDVQISSGCIIGPHCTIEGESHLGENCYLESHVFIGRQSTLGRHCRIKPFASIGSDGYGYAPTGNDVLKIPQVGKVIIEDYVDVGSGSCIDRATLTVTRIGHGTKIDNLVHIAHNCEVGKYCFITAGFAMAGSSKIGDFFMTGGTSAVGDHVVITNKVTLAGASVVTGNITESGSYGGNPLQPLQDHLKTRASLAHLPQLRKQVSKVLKHLNLVD